MTGRKAEAEACVRGMFRGVMRGMHACVRFYVHHRGGRSRWAFGSREKLGEVMQVDDQSYLPLGMRVST
jgi:hypothetical protein